MAPTPFLVRSLVSLRSEFNALATERDRASDGWIGDASHSARESDHNPDDDGGVHAIDVDKDLRRSGWSMERAVQIIVGRHRRGEDDRLQYVIYNRRIWSRSWGWTEREYTGSNPHDKHAHFSNRYTTAQENNDSEWGLLAAERSGEDQDEMDFWASAAKAARGDADATATDRTNRTNAVQVIRFALGLEVDDQTTENVPSGPHGQLSRIEAALTTAQKGAKK